MIESTLGDWFLFWCFCIIPMIVPFAYGMETHWPWRSNLFITTSSIVSGLSYAMAIFILPRNRLSEIIYMMTVVAVLFFTMGRLIHTEWVAVPPTKDNKVK
jgi:hypothetical protein